jgi:hypothetical protein
MKKTVNHYAILGRKFEDLLTLTPGVSVVQGPDGDEITFADNAAFSIMSVSTAATTTTVFLANN